MKKDVRPQPRVAWIFALVVVVLAIAAPVRADWTSETISADSPVNHSSVELDSRGRRHVVFRNEGSGTIRCLVRSAPGSWSDWAFPYYGAYPDLAVDPATDETYIAYGTMAGELALAWRDDQGAWQTTDLTSGEEVSAISIVAVDGQVHISYTNSLGQLRYRYYDTAPGSWPSVPVTLDTAASSPIETSIALRSDGLPRIAYYRDGTLRYARATNPSDLTAWSTSLVDGSADVGRYCSLALADDNTPYIAYYDQTHGALKLAKMGLLMQWQTTMVDGATWDDGLEAGLRLDPVSGLPRIVYWQHTGPTVLRLAVEQAGGTWRLEEVRGSYSTALSLALDPIGDAFIVFYDHDSATVMEASSKLAFFADGFESGDMSRWSANTQ